MTRTQSGLAAFAALAFFLAGGVFALAVVSVRPGGWDKPRPTTEAMRKPVPAGSGLTPVKVDGPADPWPECKAVRAWFRGHLNDPDSLEIVEWESRHVTDKEPSEGKWGVQKGTAGIYVRARSRNKFGAIEIGQYFFAVDPKDGHILTGRREQTSD